MHAVLFGSFGLASASQIDPAGGGSSFPLSPPMISASSMSTPTLTSSFVTPRNVAPPLSPEKYGTHGGELMSSVSRAPCGVCTQCLTTGFCAFPSLVRVDLRSDPTSVDKVLDVPS